MPIRFVIPTVVFLMVLITACGTSYKAKPLAFKAPTSYANMVDINGVQIAGQAFDDKIVAKQAFGFDIRGAGLLPVQVVFDNQSSQSLVIGASQTFLEDKQGNLWPILTERFAYERATKYAQTKKIFKEGAYSAFLGATAGAIIGAAVGIVAEEDIGQAVAKGASIGAAGGSVAGGASGLGTSYEARAAIMDDLHEKSLKNKAIQPGDLSHGIIFFPGEATSVQRLRLQLIEKDTQKKKTIYLTFN
ncbi:MAG: hypothetical protein GY874_19475 [Desulfobacteraceae bacterium]|nr:hypothetical protein [Desulfobacteraceae bacterium]